MKKLYFIMAVIFVTACSNDDFAGNTQNADINTNEVLLKKSVITAPDGTAITTNYQYDDTRLKNVTRSNGTSEAYTYTDNFLTEVRYYNNGGLVRKDNYVYGTGAFSDRIVYTYDLNAPSNNSVIRSNYAINGNEVTVTEYSGDDSSQTELIRTFTLTVTTDYNVVQFVSDDRTIAYSFDYKKSPLSEMSVYGLIILGEYKGGTNNITATQTTEGESVSYTYNTYTYNEKDFPVTQTHTEPDGSIFTTQYFY